MLNSLKDKTEEEDIIVLILFHETCSERAEIPTTYIQQTRLKSRDAKIFQL